MHMLIGSIWAHKVDGRMYQIGVDPYDGSVSAEDIVTGEWYYLTLIDHDYRLVTS